MERRRRRGRREGFVPGLGRVQPRLPPALDVAAQLRARVGLVPAGTSPTPATASASAPPAAPPTTPPPARGTLGSGRRRAAAAAPAVSAPPPPAGPRRWRLAPGPPFVVPALRNGAPRGIRGRGGRRRRGPPGPSPPLRGGCRHAVQAGHFTSSLSLSAVVSPRPSASPPVPRGLGRIGRDAAGRRTWDGRRYVSRPGAGGRGVRHIAGARRRRLRTRDVEVGLRARRRRTGGRPGRWTY